MKAYILSIGSSIMESHGLWSLTKGYSNSYRYDFDPRVTNEFLTAAFRYCIIFEVRT